MPARLAVAALLVASLVGAPSAHAQHAPGGDVIVLSGPVEVVGDDLVGNLVVLQGPTQIDGFVSGDVVAVSGDVDVTGTIGGDLVALGGVIRLAPTATIGRDVIAARAPSLAPGATVRGTIQPLETRVPVVDQMLAALVSWFAMTVSLLALALLLAALVPAPAAEAVYASAHRAPARALGVGLLVAIAIPALAWIAMMTLVGIPLGLALLLAIALMSACGYVAAAWLIGRRLAGTRIGARWSRLVALLLGLAVLRLVALVPVVHLLAWLLASSFGVGAVTLALYEARRGRLPTSRAVPGPFVASPLAPDAPA